MPCSSKKNITTVDMESPSIYIPSRSRPLSINETGYINYKNMSCTSSENSLASTQFYNPYPREYLQQESMDSPHRTRCLSFVKALVFTFIVVLLSFGVNVFYVNVLCPSDSGFITSMCLPCESLILSSDHYDDFTDNFRQVYNEDAVLECCADTTEQLQIMMDVVSTLLYFP